MTETSAIVTAESRGRRTRRPRSSASGAGLLRHSGWIGLLFLAPLLVFYGVYYLYSFGILGQVSTQRVGLTFRNAVDVGMDNFRLVLTDPSFQTSLLNTVLFGLFSVVVSMSLGFLLAMLLASGVRLRRLFYTVFLLPSLIPMSLFATVFGRMLETKDGALNQGLRAIGLGWLTPDWLGDPAAAYVAIGILLTYGIGLPIMYYSTDVAQVNLSIVESATLDGANVWQIYRIMLFPLLRSTHITVALSVILGSFRAFDVIYFSTNGQPGGRTDIAGTYIYRATTGGGETIGFAAAASIIVLIVALAISVLQIVTKRRAS